MCRPEWAWPVLIAISVSNVGVSVPDDVESLLGLEEELGDWVQLIAPRGKRSENGKVQDDDCSQEGNDVQGVRPEGVSGSTAEGDGSISGLDRRGGRFEKRLLCYGSGN